MISFTALHSSSAGNLYTVSNGASTLLLECGLTIQRVKKALDFKLHEIAAALVTHEHLDHARAASDIAAAGIDVYMSAGTAHTLGLSGNRIKTIQALTQFKIGPWVILPFPTEHDAAEPLGFLIQNGQDKLLFATDTYFVRYKFAGLTHIALEVNYSLATLQPDLHPAQKKRLLKSHMSLNTALATLEANDLSLVREIWALHLSEGNSDAEMFKETIQKKTGLPVHIAPE
jgi:phosphoribosyl 1,2-cyclic phosphodiesterase